MKLNALLRIAFKTGSLRLKGGILELKKNIIEYLKSHIIPITALIVLGLFVYLVDGILTLNFAWEDFIKEPLKSASADIVLIVTFAKKLINNSLYSNDYFLSNFYNFYPKPFLSVVAFFISVFGSLERGLLVFAIITNIILWFSLYFLLFSVSKNKFWSIIITLCALFYTRPAYQTTWWGAFRPSGMIPRNLILAFTPLLVWYFMKFKDNKRIVYLFAFLGILTNLHSMSSLHLSIWFGVSYLLLGGVKKKIPILIKSGLWWLVLSSPYIYSYLTSSFKAADVPAHIIEYRLSGYFLPKLEVVINTGKAFLVPLVLGIVGYILSRKFVKGTQKKTISALFFGNLLVVLIGLVLQKYGILVEFQFLRVTVYLYIIIYLSVMLLFIYLTSFEEKKYRIFGYLFSFSLLPFLVFPKYEAFARFSTEIPKVLISKVLPEKEKEEAVEYSDMERDRENIKIKLKESDLTFTDEEIARTSYDPTSALFESGEEEVLDKIGSRLNVEESIIFKSGWEAPYHINFAGNWVEFGEVIDYVVSNTDPNAIFMLPPNGASIFRLFTERGLVVSVKDGSASGFSKEYAERWFETYQTVRRAYHSLDPDTVVDAAKEYNADYILIYEDVPLPLELVFNNFNYWIYKVD